MLAVAIKSLRVTGQVPGNLGPGLAGVLNSATALFLSQADRFDPAELAARLPAHFPVLLTCSDADTEVTCTEVRLLLAGLRRAQANTDFVVLTGVDHLLRQDASHGATGYTTPLLFSTRLQTALRAFVQGNL